jgi:hypothetical protein
MPSLKENDSITSQNNERKDCSDLWPYFDIVLRRNAELPSEIAPGHLR